MVELHHHDRAHALTEAEIRRELTRRARRIVPVLLFFALVATALATTDPPADPDAFLASGPTDSAAGGGLPGSSGPSPGSAGAGTGPTAGEPQGGASGPAGAGTSAGQSGAAAGPSPDGGPDAAQSAGGTGVSVAGVDCSTTERQLPTSRYGAACRAASDGTNPGATASGVTAEQIVVTFRISDSGQSAALRATGGTAADSLGGNQDEVAADLSVLVDHLNGIYDLYGRQVVLKVFRGQGDFLAEFQNQNVQGAQSDAARARDQGAFADISIVTMTQPYAEALVSQGIVALSPVYLSRQWYEERAPFAFGALWPAGTDIGQFMGNAVCARYGGGVSHAGDDRLKGRDRVFGIIHPENPEFALAADAIDSTIRACGRAPARRISYALNIATAQNEHTNAVAQMKAAGVTTVLCLCDEFSPIFLTRAADQQQFQPEWMQLWWPDPWQRLASQNQWKNSVHTGGKSPDFGAGEAGDTWRAAAGDAAPAAPGSLNLVHQQLVALFSALQAAGPNLSPQTFESGWFALPPTADGDFGPWEFGSGLRTARSHFRLGWYDPGSTSAYDGKAGAILDCAVPFARFDDVGALGTGDVPCFGR